MDHAVKCGLPALAAVLLAGATPGILAAPSTTTGATTSSAAARQEDQETLAAFKQNVWLIYSSSAAIGPDARGRTIAEDIAIWVLPGEIRRQLHEAAANFKGEMDQGQDPAALKEPQRRLTLVAFYWAQQVTLRHQRALWLQALEQAPSTEVELSRGRIDALENQLEHDFAPTMTLEALTGEIKELTMAYDSERQRLVGLGPEVRGDVFERSGDLPCTHMVAQEPGTGATHPVRVLWSPMAMDFYPMTGHRDLLTGRVLLQMTADDAGCAQHIEVMRSSGAPEIDAAALDLAARIQFAPAVRDGRPVQTTVRLPVVFKFEDTPSPDFRLPTVGAAPALPTPSGLPPSLSALTPAEHIRTGNELLNDNEFDKAIAEFDIAIAADPAAARAYADRGLAHLWKSNGTQAHDDFETALRLEPNNAVALRGRGVLEYLSGDCASAQADLSRSFEIDSRSSFPLQWRAEADSCLSQDAEAIADLAKAENVKPKGFNFYSQRALVLRALGRPDEALAEIDAMLAVSGESRAQLTAGAIYEEAGRPAEAAAALDLGVSLAPTDSAYIRRAKYRPRADLRAQREDYAAALKVNPASSYALMGLIKVSALEGGDSPEVLSTALASHPDDVTGLLGRGIDHWRRGERSAADEDLRASLQRAGNSEFNDVCYTLAIVNAALDRALEACNRALESMPRVANILDSRALVYLRLGRLKEAQADYDLALKFRPHSADSLYGRGLVFARLGQSRSADADRAEALRLDATIAEYFHTIQLDR
jgi:TonB family protein